MFVTQPPFCGEDGTLKFNVAGVAGFYSQLAGVLAGLAFAALIFLVSARLDAGRARGGADAAPDKAAAPLGSAYRMLLSSFLALTCASLGYAVQGGATVSSGRAATEEVVLAVAFSLAGMMLFYAVVLTLDATENLSADGPGVGLQVSSFVRGVLIGIVAPIIIIYTSLGLTDYSDIRYGKDRGLSLLEVVAIVAVVIQVLVSWVLYPILRKRGFGRERLPIELSGAVARIGWAYLIIVLLAVVTFGVIDAGASTDPCRTLSPVIPLVAFVTTAASVVFMTGHVIWYGTEPRTRTSETTPPPSRDAES
ncbi:hypothetical protein FHX82_003182 [Amycolatopsis bartoniae]|uniref:Uncharacterized protein n=1 Tax=Amycolatopsis bartoniae TaxID=941986 RepID=A0A8H9J6C9_9PSEU|nr:hypothetical protein [Amycolatopsis bartoniae]MBB2936128.1 hypothetical protein [Amycolatopsis bartoniae]TVT07158.1 hypothetical protein FNH07_17650 [Amycolatopsis bartoniae]GHF81361.1 hypothetical protein GCM10017566_64460 [Amycolatopsis bartoniae]